MTFSLLKRNWSQINWNEASSQQQGRSKKTTTEWIMKLGFELAGKDWKMDVEWATNQLANGIKQEKNDFIKSIQTTFELILFQQWNEINEKIIITVC